MRRATPLTIAVAMALLVVTACMAATCAQANTFQANAATAIVANAPPLANAGQTVVNLANVMWENPANIAGNNGNTLVQNAGATPFAGQNANEALLKNGPVNEVPFNVIKPRNAGTNNSNTVNNNALARWTHEVAFNVVLPNQANNNTA